MDVRDLDLTKSLLSDRQGGLRAGLPPHRYISDHWVLGETRCQLKSEFLAMGGGHICV